MGNLTVARATNGGRTERTLLNVPVEDYDDASQTLIEWLWLHQSLSMTQKVIMAWMRGEMYKEHGLWVRYYVSGTVGDWFTIRYSA